MVRVIVLSFGDHCVMADTVNYERGLHQFWNQQRAASVSAILSISVQGRGRVDLGNILGLICPCLETKKRSSFCVNKSQCV